MEALLHEQVHTCQELFHQRVDGLVVRLGGLGRDAPGQHAAASEERGNLVRVEGQVCRVFVSVKVENVHRRGHKQRPVGVATAVGPTLAVVEEYDPATDQWTQKADMPTGRSGMSTSVVNGKIYVIGGWGEGDQPLSTVEEYDPVTDTWTRKADMPTCRDSLATVAVDGKIYAIGGYPPAGPWMGGSSTMEVYDPEIDTWTRKADMLVGLGFLNAHVVSGKIYVVGGRPYVQSGTDVLEYDPATDTWTRKADILVGTSQMDSVVLDEKIFVFGGWYWSNNSPYTIVQMYNPGTDIWTQEADVPFQRAAFSAEVVRGRIFVIGGTDRRHPCPATSTVYEYVNCLIA